MESFDVDIIRDTNLYCLSGALKKRRDDLLVAFRNIWTLTFLESRISTIGDVCTKSGI